MARTVKSNGFSLIELFIAMSILAVIALLGSSMLVFSKKTHNMSLSSDEAYAIAKEKLAELQQENSTTFKTGTEDRLRGAVTYTMQWTIDETREPDLAIVTVNWRGKVGIEKIEVSGFVRAKICPTITGNRAPTDIRLSNTMVKDSAPIGTFIGTFSAADLDSSKGDAFRYSLVSGGGKFLVYSNVLKTVAMLTTGSYPVRVKVRDCAGLEFEKSFTITAVPVVKPEINNQTFDIDEHVSRGTSPTPIRIVAIPEGISYVIKSQSVNDVFTLDPMTGILKVYDTLNLDFETHPIITLQVRVGKDTKAAEATMTVNLRNVNDAPLLTKTSPALQLPQVLVLDNSAAGIQVSSLAGDNIVDVDVEAVKGIAITEVTEAGECGTWQVNIGAGWIDLGNVSATSAMLLGITNKVRFVPSFMPRGAMPVIRFSAWDKTVNSEGQKADASLFSLTCPYSKESDTALVPIKICNNTILIDAVFQNNADGFVYMDDAFKSTTKPNNAEGTYDGENHELVVTLGKNGTNVTNMSGGWKRTVSLESSSKLRIYIEYNIRMHKDYKTTELGQVLCSIAGTLYGRSPDTFIEELKGDGVGGTERESGWKSFVAVTNATLSGSVEVRVGGFNNAKTVADEKTIIQIGRITLCKE
ncbi:MAG: prepilin-type N-terminal cleavage/methylation domain-containing protein [Chitinivibrionales bacterium]|nr:prepilin-type N-terminal cleavage/methylation domain-containing protein [Chitinivibrionales bacterium]